MDNFKYGASYYPSTHDRSDWDNDLLQMKSAGMHYIRTGELFNGWEQIEYEHGKYEFRQLDEFFNLCAKMQMKIILGTGTAAPPRWLLEEDQAMVIVDEMHHPFATDASYSWACPHNPTYLYYAKRWIEVLVNRYRTHPALFAYQIHNEVGLPFKSMDGIVHQYCYCEHTRNEFQNWIKLKYGTIEKLNYAWSWSSTHPHYTSFEQVILPRYKPTSWSSVTKWIDFRTFMMDSITVFVGWQNDIIKALDALHKTTVNTFYMKGEDKLGVLCGIDQFSLAHKVDTISYDLYPGSGNKMEDREEFMSMFLDHGKSVAHAAQQDFWLIELESGPINGWALGPDRDTNASDISRYVCECLGHQVNMILFMGYRQWDFQPLNWGGLVDLDGGETKRFLAAKQLGEFMQDHHEVCNTSYAKASRVAILVSSRNAIIANGMGHEAFLVDSIRAHYITLYQMGFQIDFLNELDFSKKASQYKLIMAPFYISLSETFAGQIKQYMQEGGLFVAEARFGFVNEQGWLHHSFPCKELKEAFAIQQTSIQVKQDIDIQYNDTFYKGYWHHEEFGHDGANVLARYQNGKAAVVSNSFGKGEILYFATHASLAYLKHNSLLFHDILSDKVKERNIYPDIEIYYKGKERREVDGHIVNTTNGYMLIVTCYNKQEGKDLFHNHQLEVELHLHLDYEIKKVKLGYGKATLQWSCKDEETILQFTLYRDENIVIFLDK